MPLNLIKQFCNKLTKLNTSSKKNYYLSELQQTKRNACKTWDIIKIRVPNKKKDSSDTVKIIAEDKEIKRPNDVSNQFNEFFCNIEKSCKSP